MGACVAEKHLLVVTHFCWAGAHVWLVELLTYYLPYEGHHLLLWDPPGPLGIVPTLPLSSPLYPSQNPSWLPVSPHIVEMPTADTRSVCAESCARALET